VRARGNVSFVFSIRNKGITKLIFLINQVNNRLAETTSSLFFFTVNYTKKEWGSWLRTSI